MKRFLTLFLLILACSFVFSDNSISQEISSQTKDFFYKFSSQTEHSQIVSSDDLVNSEIITSIAQGVSANQICISLGKFSSNSNWFIESGGTKIRYTGEEDKKLEFFALCETGNKLKQALVFFPKEKINQNFISHCSQFEENNEKLACAVILVQATSISTGEFSVAYQLFFIFALLVIIPLLLVLLKTENINLRLFALIKVIFLISIFIIFYFIGLVLHTLAIILLLFFFFIQVNLSIAPLILELQLNDLPISKLMLKIVLLIEIIGLLIAIILLAPLL